MPIALRSDFDAGQLRRVARRTKDAPQARRLLALAAIYEGATRTQAAAMGGVTLQIVRDWVMKFNAHGPMVLSTGRRPGSPHGSTTRTGRRSRR
jgi:putative transposase